jgi:glycosyltransferase involved in cell wall biosynthesis
VPEPSLSLCMVTTFYPPYHFGGDAMYIYRLSNELARRGHRVTVVHCVDAYKTLRPAEPGGRFPHHPNVTVHRLRSRWGMLSPLVTYLAGRPGLKAPALDTIFRQRFDVVHFHNVSLIGGPGVLRYGDGVKLYTMHEHWLVCPMHVLWKYNREVCVERDCFRCTLTFRRPPQLWRYTDLLPRALPEVDLFLSPSRFTAEQHRRQGFDHPIRVLPYFLPASEAQPAVDGERAGLAAGESSPSPDASSDRPYFLFVGRLEKIKGLQTLIERFRTYREADLLVAGDGDYGEELRRQAAGLPHVRFLGRVHPTGLRALYAGAIALLVPSICYEVFGIVSLEAFAQRTPVIVRDLGGLPECVQESGGGMTYRTDEELEAAMERLRREPALRRELGERGYRGYLERWSEAPHLREYLAAIDQARARRAARAAVAATP